jgi:hypothetical protein
MLQKAACLTMTWKTWRKVEKNSRLLRQEEKEPDSPDCCFEKTAAAQKKKKKPSSPRKSKKKKKSEDTEKGERKCTFRHRKTSSAYNKEKAKYKRLGYSPNTCKKMARAAWLKVANEIDSGVFKEEKNSTTVGTDVD